MRKLQLRVGRRRRLRVQWGFLNGRARRLGPFSTAGARRLRAFVHYRSWLVYGKIGKQQIPVLDKQPRSSLKTTPVRPFVWCILGLGLQATCNVIPHQCQCSNCTFEHVTVEIKRVTGTDVAKNSGLWASKCTTRSSLRRYDANVKPQQSCRGSHHLRTFSSDL